MKRPPRQHSDSSTPVVLPARGEAVTLRTSNGGHIPGRVLEQGPDRLQIAILVPTKPFSARDLDGLVVEFRSPQGRIRLSGACAVPDPSEPDLLSLESLRSIEVLQQREYVRINSARPVLVYRAGERLQVSSYTVDLSGSGLLLAGPDTLGPGEEISFQLSLEPRGVPVAGTGRVVRVDDQGRRAVAFTDVSELDRRRLVRFIFACQREERRRGLSSGGSRRD